MWNTIAKYDEISVYFEGEDETEIHVVGEVTNLTDDRMVVRDNDGAYHLVRREELIDLDHIARADRDENYRY